MSSTIPLIVVATQQPVHSSPPAGPAMFTGIMLMVVVLWGFCLYKLIDLEADRRITEEQSNNWSVVLNYILGIAIVAVFYFCLALDH